jgi:hypothetical protein
LVTGRAPPKFTYCTPDKNFIERKMQQKKDDNSFISVKQEPFNRGRRKLKLALEAKFYI